MQWRVITLVLVGVSTIGCTPGVNTPVPTAPSPRPTRLTITPLGGGTMIVGNTAPLTTSGAPAANGGALGAFAEYDNGQGRYVEAAWTSSDEDVVAVVGSMLVARGTGTAMLTATFEGLSDAENFQVDGGFFGRWSGSFVVEQCGANNSSMEHVLCRPEGDGGAGLAPVGATLAIALEIPETTGEDITGRVTLGQFSGALTGRNRGNGYFSLAGQAAAPGGSITFVDWNMRATGGVMEGVFGYHLTLDGVSGTGGVGARLSNVTRQ